MIPFYKPPVHEGCVDILKEVLDSGWTTSGPKCEALAQMFRTEFQQPYVTPVASCTQALEISWKLAGLGPGDQVVVPVNTFVSTAISIIKTGARVILAPLGKDGFTSDVNVLLEVGDGGTGFAPVHYGGMPIADVSRLTKLEGKVVEDCAHGPFYDDDGLNNFYSVQRSKSFACCYSFYANKPITCGEGGLVSFSDKDNFDKAIIHSLHGMSSDARRRFESSKFGNYDVLFLGDKANLSDINAAIALVSARFFEVNRIKRKAIWEQITTELRSIEDIKFLEHSSNSSYHLFACRSPAKEKILSALSDANIGFSVHYKPLSLHSAFVNCELVDSSRLNGNETQYYAEAFTLPLFPDMTESDAFLIIDVIRRAMRS